MLPRDGDIVEEDVGVGAAADGDDVGVEQDLRTGVRSGDDDEERIGVLETVEVGHRVDLTGVRIEDALERLPTGVGHALSTGNRVLLLVGLAARARLLGVLLLAGIVTLLARLLRIAAVLLVPALLLVSVLLVLGMAALLVVLSLVSALVVPASGRLLTGRVIGVPAVALPAVLLVLGRLVLLLDPPRLLLAVLPLIAAVVRCLRGAVDGGLTVGRRVRSRFGALLLRGAVAGAEGELLRLRDFAVVVPRLRGIPATLVIVLRHHASSLCTSLWYCSSSIRPVTCSGSLASTRYIHPSS
ncbi:Uncharacterised protein [Mycobacteroides abscessus subsp. abscessus]|nr:Uncharacterised protein [Mycobacteroides abscessus subsp. abscessus]